MRTTSTQRSRSEVVYTDLREALIHGRYRPNQRLNLAELRANAGVSLSVVREAVTRLASEGLVRAEPNRGFFAPGLSAADIDDLALVRVNIEMLAIRRSIELGDTTWEASVLAAHHRMTRTPLVTQMEDPEAAAEWNKAHAAFHESCASACASRRLLEIRARLYDESEVMRQMTVATKRDVAAEHRAILDAILARDADAATQAIRAHIETTARVAAAATRAQEEWT